MNDPGIELLRKHLLSATNGAFLEEVSVFADSFRDYTYQKKELIVRPGEVSNILFFVNEGVQRSYYLGDKEYTIAFAYEDSFCTIPDSFLLNRPSKHYLEAVTFSRMIGIERDAFYRFMDAYPWLMKLMLTFQEMILGGLHDRMTEIMALGMEQRFEAFCARSFKLFARVPHKHIASYLNIDPTNLSKLLNKKLV